MEILIGAGGWQYFSVEGADPLEAYSRAFNFVEVNSTFYRVPPLEMVDSWRRRVPSKFQFSVRCHRDITHRERFRPLSLSLARMEDQVRICSHLRAEILHLQAPSIPRIQQEIEGNLPNLLSGVDLYGVRIALEVRLPEGRTLSRGLVKMMEDLDVIHCTDISRSHPQAASDTMYTRLFGKGQHTKYQFDDDELAEISNSAQSGDYKKALFTFHGVRMYKDAARFLTFKKVGAFPKVTSSTGLSSLKEVLSEDAPFPSTKRQLIRHQGWKVIELSEEKRGRAADLLRALPERTYSSISEVLDSLRESLQRRG